MNVSDGERRLVVISRNPTMTWGLTLPGCLIDSVRPQHLNEWATNARQEAVDLIILDVGTSEAAVDGVRKLRANARLAPILLISGDEESWHSTEVLELPGTHLLALPIDRQRLLHAISNLIDIDVPTDTPVVAEEPHGTVADEPRTGTTRLVPSSSITTTKAQVPEVAATSNTTPITASTASTPGQQSPDTHDPHAAVRVLLRRVDRMFGVAETGWAILSDVKDHMSIDAGCLLVHDALDGDWHVIADEGLAQVERHMRLDGESWWISTVVHGGQAAIMTNDNGSSIGATPAPLSRRKQVLACGIPNGGGLLLLARDGDAPFDEADLARIAAIIDEAGPLLADAVDVRSLARSLAPMIERPERLST